MKILWFSWKDIKHPYAGGAEFLSDKIMSASAQNGHEVLLITSSYLGASHKDKIHGYSVIRMGNHISVYWEAFRYYKKNLVGWADHIIEEINTIPFMTQWYAKEKRTLLFYQLCREIWFYQLWFPLSLVGYLVEPLYLFLLRNNNVLTESKSTKIDLQRYGFKKEHITIFPVCIDIEPIKSIKEKKTYDRFTVLSLGAIRNMKRTFDQVKAFELAKKEIPELQMKIAGKPIGKYGIKVLEYIKNSPHAKDIEYLGKVSKAQKIELMSKSHILLVTSVKEGWGLVVTEAASQGTPAIVYDVDGLRDSVERKNLITNVAINELVYKINLLYKDQRTYKKFAKEVLKDSRNFENYKSYDSFISYIHLSK